MEGPLGKTADVQVRATLDQQRSGSAFDYGTADTQVEGRAALGKLVDRLERTASLRFPLHITAIRRRDANAIALPGGRMYLFQGLIAKAETPDELAGVIAYEIGHVAARDGTKAVLRSGGLSFLFGMLLCDFVGGGAVVLAARTVL